MTAPASAVHGPHRTPGTASARVLVLLLCLASSGCALLGPKGEPSTIYAPDPRISADPAWPSVEWQLSLIPITAARMIDSQRIVVRPTAQEMQVYKDATWAKRPTDMLEDALLRALEDSGRIPAIARQGSGVNADYKLVLDLRRFESDYAGQATPSAVIEVNAKLLHAQDARVVATRTFVQTHPAGATDIVSVVKAFDRALEATTRELAGWILTTGAAHDRSAHR